MLRFRSRIRCDGSGARGGGGIPSAALLGRESVGMGMEFLSNTYTIRTLSSSRSGVSTEYIQTSRASLATVTDVNGLVRWAPHNLFPFSEQFDQWVQTGVTVEANARAAPDGTLTAERILASSGTGGKHVQRTVSGLEKQMTVSVFARINTHGFIQIVNSGDAQAFCNFNLSTGAVGTAGTKTTGSITSAGSGWFLCTATFNDTTTYASQMRIYLVPSASAVYGEALAAAGTEAVYLWGAQLNRSDLGGMQSNTSVYPLYNPSTPKNLVGFTEDFTNSVWVKYRSTVTSNAAVAPNGFQVADKLVPDSGLTQGAVFNSAGAAVGIVSGGIYTASIYAKAAELGFVFVSLNVRVSTTAQGVCVNLSTGAISNQGAFGTYTVTNVGNGWWRISCTGTANATAGYIEAYPLAAAGTDTSYTGDGTSGIFIWGAQFSDSASVEPYISNPFAVPVAGAYHGPRRDFNPITRVSRGLLIEEATTNLLTSSGAIDQGIWQKTSCTITANQVTGPDGTLSGDLLTVTSTSNPNVFNDIGAFTGGVPYTASVWVRAGNTSTAVLQIFTNGGAGSVTVTASAVISGPGTITPSADLITVNGLSTTQWTRISVSGTPAAGGTLAVYIKPRGAGSTIGDTIYIWGAQLEQKALATSYVPTEGSTVTRSIDVITLATSAFPYSTTEGSFVVNFTTLNNGQASVIRRPFTLDNGGPSFQVGPTFVYDNSTFLVNDFPADPGKHGVALKTNDFAIVANGGAARTGTGTFSGNQYNILRLGYDYSNLNHLNGHIRELTYIPRRLTNTELQQRTA